MTGRLIALLYGLASYVLFLSTFTYAMGFVGNVGVPRAIDGAPVGPPLASLLIDVALLGVFAVQHSVMARPAFKRRWTRVISPAVERSTFVLAASLALALLFWQWRPLGGVVWDVEAPWLRFVLHVACVVGWLIVLLTTFLIDHFGLFGVKQVWRHFRGGAVDAPKFVMPAFYRFVRHPLYFGFLLAFWSAPTMTATHLLFAAATTGYILVAIQLEERDLVEVHPEYAEYRRRVPMIVPGAPADAIGAASAPRPTLPAER